jgi:hypothetical protein
MDELDSAPAFGGGSKIFKNNPMQSKFAGALGAVSGGALTVVTGGYT